jgi:hypothetical protein
MDYKPGALPGAVATIVAVLFVVAIVLVIVTWPLMLLINWLFAPSLLLAIFGVSHLGFWQTWALMFICSVLFGKSTSSSK